MKQINITMLPANSAEVRGRCERILAIQHERSPKESAMHGITGMEEAKRCLREVYLPAFYREFSKPYPQHGSAFVRYVRPDLTYWISCVNTMAGSWARITVFLLRGLRFKFPQTPIACTM